MKRGGHVEGIDMAALDQATVRTFDEGSVTELLDEETRESASAGMTSLTSAQLKVLITGATGQIGSEVLRQAAEPGGKTYRIGADVTSYAEIAEIMAKVVGRPFINRSREEYGEATRCNNDFSLFQPCGHALASGF